MPRDVSLHSPFIRLKLDRLKPTTLFFYTLSFNSNLCMGYPTIGDSFDKVAVTVNLYDIKPGPNIVPNPRSNLAPSPNVSQCDFTKFKGVQYEIIDKQTLIEGKDLTGHFYTSNPDTSMFSLYAMPSVYSTDESLEMATVNNCIAPNGVHVVTPNGVYIRVLEFDSIGPPTDDQDVPIFTTRLPPNADQPDTNVLIDTGDNRIRSAFRHFGSPFNDIVLAFNDQCTGVRTDRNDKGCRSDSNRIGYCLLHYTTLAYNDAH